MKNASLIPELDANSTIPGKRERERDGERESRTASEGISA